MSKVKITSTLVQRPLSSNPHLLQAFASWLFKAPAGHPDVPRRITHLVLPLCNRRHSSSQTIHNFLYNFRHKHCCVSSQHEKTPCTSGSETQADVPATDFNTCIGRIKILRSPACQGKRSSRNRNLSPLSPPCRVWYDKVCAKGMWFSGF